MAKRLTNRQHTVLEIIKRWIRERGYPPTIRELGQQLGIKSLRGVTTHLDAIAKKGFLKREAKARSISLLDVMAPFEHALQVPVVGRIRAGVPVLAQEQIESHVVVDGSWIGASSSPNTPPHFALHVKGDSMINAGILEGDYVIVRQQAAAEHGDIVAALVGEEATIKRLFKQDGQLKLMPEHPTMEPILIGPGRSLTILGKVVAVFRKL